jgi:hypothetical protein
VQKIVKLICPAAANAFARNATRDAFDARQSRCVPRCARPSAIGASAPGSHLLLFFFLRFVPATWTARVPVAGDYRDHEHDRRMCKPQMPERGDPGAGGRAELCEFSRLGVHGPKVRDREC